MCVLIKDLPRSGLHVCANKRLTGRNLQPRAFSQPWGVSPPIFIATAKHMSVLGFVFDALTELIHRRSSHLQKLHYNAVSTQNRRIVCIIMQFLQVSPRSTPLCLMHPPARKSRRPSWHSHSWLWPSWHSHSWLWPSIWSLGIFELPNILRRPNRVRHHATRKQSQI
jgi:hypothetical protein